VGTTLLTFTAVETRTAAELTEATHLIVPFLRFVPIDPTCTTHCAIAAIDYRWMKRSVTGWVVATREEIRLVVGRSRAYLDLVIGHDNGRKRAGFAIPSTISSGTIPWTAANADLGGLSESGLLSSTIADLCHLRISYDELGMRMFGGIGNAPGTCAPQ
jgi:hypothetical protein